MAICALCGQSVEKLVAAHVLPKSFYGETISSTSGPARVYASGLGARPYRSQAGEYDCTILCASCERSLSPFDNYAYEVFFQRNPDEAVVMDDKIQAWVLKNIDVEKLAIFFASLLWRMHVSNRPMFRAVRLGPYADKFREAILTRSAPPSRDLDVVVTRFDKSDTGILGPYKTRTGGVQGYRFAFAGHACLAKVGSGRYPDAFSEVALSAKKNELRLIARAFAGSPECVAMQRTLGIHFER